MRSTLGIVTTKKLDAALLEIKIEVKNIKQTLEEQEKKDRIHAAQMEEIALQQKKILKIKDFDEHLQKIVIKYQTSWHELIAEDKKNDTKDKKEQKIPPLITTNPIIAAHVFYEMQSLQQANIQNRKKLAEFIAAPTHKDFKDLKSTHQIAEFKAQITKIRCEIDKKEDEYRTKLTTLTKQSKQQRFLLSPQLQRNIAHNFSTLENLKKAMTASPQKVIEKCEQRVLKLEQYIAQLKLEIQQYDQEIIRCQNNEYFYQHHFRVPIQAISQILILQLANRAQHIVTPPASCNFLNAEGQKAIAHTLANVLIPYDRWIYWFSSRKHAQEVTAKALSIERLLNKSLLSCWHQSLGSICNIFCDEKDLTTLNPLLLNEFAKILLPPPAGFLYRWSRFWKTQYHRQQDAEHARKMKHIVDSFKLACFRQRIRWMAHREPELSALGLLYYAEEFNRHVQAIKELLGAAVKDESLSAAKLLHNCYKIGTHNNPVIAALIQNKNYKKHLLKEAQLEKNKLLAEKEVLLKQISQLGTQLAMELESLTKQNASFNESALTILSENIAALHRTGFLKGPPRTKQQPTATSFLDLKH